MFGWGIMDPLYRALSHYRMRQFRQCVDVCTEILTADGRNQAAWILKMRALTQQVSFDDIEVMESLVDGAGDQQKAMTCTARPGTSLLKSALSTVSCIERLHIDSNSSRHLCDGILYFNIYQNCTIEFRSQAVSTGDKMVANR